MSVAKDPKNNTWYVRMRVKDASGKVVYTKKRGFKTQKAAKQYEAERKLVESNSVSMLFEDFCTEIYLPNVKPVLKESTYRNYYGIITRDLIPYFGKYRLDGITSADIIKWHNFELTNNGRYGRPKSIEYRQREHIILAMVINYAIRFYGLKGSNPAEVVGNFKKTKKKEMKIWTQEEFSKFIKVLEENDSVLAHLAYCGFYLGARRGELLALQRKDFNFENNTVSISKTRYRAGNNDYRITTPKTAQSFRTVKMPGFLAEKMKAYFDSFPEFKDDQFVFDVDDGALGRAIRKYAPIAGVKVIRPHDLRHSYISNLIMLGLPASVVAKMAGHSSLTILSNYMHSIDEAQQDVANALENLHSMNDETSSTE